MESTAPDTRTSLLQAALVCFADHGFDGTSMRMIADKAGRPLSLLSHYFGNKEGLYVEVFSLLLEKSRQRRNDLIPEGGYTPRDAKEAVRLLREQIHSLYFEVAMDSSHQDSIRELGSRLWLREIRSPRPSLSPLLLHHMAPMTETIKKCIRTLRPDLGEAEVVFLGISILGQVVGHGLMFGLNQVVWGRAEMPGNPFQASEWLVDLCLHGLTGAPPPA
ncbi:MAG TPA: TetR/AcrR family transcriptional regulator [Geothrix sp.]|jgi:AcrR family transcriptional regulator